MNTTLIDTGPITANETIVASYRSHTDAEFAVRRLASGGVPVNTISIIGRNFETHEDVVGFYRPADAALDGAGQGAWFGGLFGFLIGAMGFFVLPVVGAFMVIGPLSGMIAGAIGGAGVGALVNGLVAAGIPRHQALKYQARLQAGEFMVVVHGNSVEAAKAHEILEASGQTFLQLHRADAEDSTAA